MPAHERSRPALPRDAPWARILLVAGAALGTCRRGKARSMGRGFRSGPFLPPISSDGSQPPLEPFARWKTALRKRRGHVRVMRREGDNTVVETTGGGTSTRTRALCRVKLGVVRDRVPPRSRLWPIMAGLPGDGEGPQTKAPPLWETLRGTYRSG